MNLFNSSAAIDADKWLGLAAADKRHQLVIDGDAGDSVTIAGVAGVSSWTQSTTTVDGVTSATTVSNNGHTYNVYTSSATNNVGTTLSYAELLIDTSITRTIA
jgi:hypothetical protein